MHVDTPNIGNTSNFTQHKYFKPAVLGILVLITVLILLAILLVATKDKEDKDNSANQLINQIQAPQQTLQDKTSVKSYPTNVCPTEIIYDQGLPIGVWDGEEYQVTDPEGIQWLDTVCKPLIQNGITTNAKAPWQFMNDEWVYTSGTAPACPSQLLQVSPVNVSLATSILYPGQTRGQYKPHGGFRFDNSSNDAIDVKLPITARLVGGAKYTEGGDVQYLLDFVSDCGIAIRFDHLYELTGEFKTIGDSMPLNPPGDSRGVLLDGKEFPAGILVATSVGIPSMNNTGFDFGVYDYRQRNQASQSAEYVAKYAQYSAAQSFYALCWLDLLPSTDAAIAKSLPGGDAQAGKTSDYCK